MDRRQLWNGWQRNVICMWLAQMAINIGFFGVIPFMALYMGRRFGITDINLRGYHMAHFQFAGMLAYAIFTPIWGALGDRLGVKLMLYRGSFVAGALYLLMCVVPDVRCLIGLRFLIGAMSGTTVASQMLIVKTTPGERQGVALGVFSTSVWGGNMIGEPLGAFIMDKFGFNAAFCTCAALFFVSGIFVYLAQDSEKARPAERPAGDTRSPLARKFAGFREVFTPSVLMMLFLFLLMGAGQRLHVPYTALKVESIVGAAAAAKWTGIIGSAAAFTGMISGVCGGWLSDKYPEWKIITPTQLASAVLLLLIAGAASPLGFGVCYALNSFALGGIHPAMQKVICSLVENTRRGVVLGWATTLNNVGYMMATLASGVLVRDWGLRPMYLTASAMMFLLAAAGMAIVIAVHRLKAKRDAAGA